MKEKLFIYKGSFGALCIAALLSLSTACTSLIPDDLDALGDDVTLTVKEFTPYLGRTTVYENIVNVSNKSTLPLEYNIVGARKFDGGSAPELLEKYPIKVWKQNYTGDEKSIEEIEAKRKVEHRSMLDIQHKSGDLVFWGSGNSTFVKNVPDEGYLFDVEVKNTGGRRYFRNVALKPYKERAYEPSQYDAISGLARDAFLRPNIIGIHGERTGDPIFDISAYIFKQKNDNPGNTFTVSVIDSLGKPIDVRNFNQTDFAHLVHGFNPRYDGGKVTYDVAYPMPLIAYPTRYTDASGARSRVALLYDRIGFGGIRQLAALWMDIAIYEEGHWELQFRFNGESPKFSNEQ